MILRVEISAPTDCSWRESDLRRKLKRAITEAISNTLDDRDPVAELNSLTFRNGAAKRQERSK